ncbi:MAG: nucleotidyltransferase domain-containing protein [Methanothrix sp.]|nr:nucleotidyltransferase domain-containing protein [Methanothrix sp.]
MFEEMIDSYLARLKEIKGYDVKSVILFGSVARGQAKEHSDIDIIIVASGLPELRNRDSLPPFPKPARIQDIWMTPEELEDMTIAKTGFLVDALLEGQLLRDDGTAAAAREKLVESLKRLKAKKLKSGWMIPREDLRAVISFD